MPAGGDSAHSAAPPPGGGTDGRGVPRVPPPGPRPTGTSGPDERPGRAAARRARRSRKKPKPRWRRTLVWASGGLALLIVGVAAAGFLYIWYLNSNIDKEPLNLSDNQLERSQPNAAGQVPLNILLLGSDSRTGEENQSLGGGSEGGQRADVQMLLHASADRSNISVISVPRDTMVTIPECTDPDTGEVYPELQKERINAALGHGGPGCVVATWELLTGIPIDHFMMIDFAGVVDMADAVGGVPVCVTANVDDPDSHLRLEAGTTVVEGEQALAWLRTRHAFEYGGDVPRTRAQQIYLSNMVEQLQAGTSLTNPGRLMDLAEAATNALTVDNALGSVQDLYDLGTDLRSVPNERVNMVTMPSLPDPDNPEITLVPDPERSEEIFSLVRDDIPLDDPDAEPPAASESEEPTEEPAAEPDPAAEISVSVRNGTGTDVLLPVNGRATALTEELRRLGFALASTDATTFSSSAETTVLYPEAADQANARAVAEALGVPEGALRVSPQVSQITLIIGADWREGLAYPEDAAAGGGESADPGTGGEDDPPPVPEDMVSGRANDDCMEVNPAYTW
ncbi:LCP family protein [Streptomyces sp. DSM 44917]|uniref:LCP family protein n=1 Tax=Streptomyces boetiae TaxID=3075541 RepID=A0ABU2LFE9_9ACTN|nr:LCP family protein [Streptomyces sp. DSM 44917]MDT0310242.1 LCP family protein [Streptomyces sp. DSM 44917]